MRELNAGSHKVRRSSFSNTLSLLPEVEEPYSEANSPVPTILEVTKSTVKAQVDSYHLPAQVDSYHLPAVVQVASFSPESRPRTQTLPSMSKTKLYNKHPHYGRRFSSDSTASGGRLGGPSREVLSHARKVSGHVTHPHWKGSASLGHVPERRRWSIGSPTSRDGQNSGGPEACAAKNEAHNSWAHHHQAVVAMATTAQAGTPIKCASDLWRPLKSARKFSDPSVALEEKDRLEILHDPALNRRWSNPAFAETARKVNLILRLGQNMRHKLNPLDDRPDHHKGIRTLADLAVDMPKTARFSALMSPEAQYSIMMGYEDKLYHGLVQKCPEYENVLKRSKTPVLKVHIRRKSCLGFLNDDDDDVDDEDDDEGDGDSDEESSEQHTTTGASFLTQSTEESGVTFSTSNLTGSRYQQHRGSTHSLDSSISQLPGRPDSRHTLRHLRRLSLSIEKKDYLNRLFDRLQDEDEDSLLDASSLTLPRSCSLPDVSCLPFSRRLALTHRLENAMDILDAMKGQGEVMLSPRLKARKSAPLADYNSWVHEWNKEFRVRPGKS